MSDERLNVPPPNRIFRQYVIREARQYASLFLKVPQLVLAKPGVDEESFQGGEASLKALRRP